MSTSRSTSRSASGKMAKAVGALTYAVPHLSGAIDILVVRQPDGSFKSSPFYVRFGKYTGLRSQDKRVRIVVNDSELDFCMHLGRTGEVYFVTEEEAEVEGELEAAEAMAISEAALDGMASPTGYSDDEDAGGGSPRRQLQQGAPAVAAAAEVLMQQEQWRQKQQQAGAAAVAGEREGSGSGGKRGREMRRSSSEPAFLGPASSPGTGEELPGPTLSGDHYWTPRSSIDQGGALSASLSAEASGQSLGAKHRRELSYGQLSVGSPHSARSTDAGESTGRAGGGGGEVGRGEEAHGQGASPAAALAQQQQPQQAEQPQQQQGHGPDSGAAGALTAAAALGPPLWPAPAVSGEGGQAAPPNLRPLPHVHHMHIGAHGATAIPAQPQSFDPAWWAAAEVQHAARARRSSEASSYSTAHRRSSSQGAQLPLLLRPAQSAPPAVARPTLAGEKAPQGFGSPACLGLDAAPSPQGPSSLAAQGQQQQQDEGMAEQPGGTSAAGGSPAGSPVEHELDEQQQKKKQQQLPNGFGGGGSNGSIGDMAASLPMPISDPSQCGTPSGGSSGGGGAAMATSLPVPIRQPSVATAPCSSRSLGGSLDAGDSGLEHGLHEAHVVHAEPAELAEHGAEPVDTLPSSPAGSFDGGAGSMSVESSPLKREPLGVAEGEGGEAEGRERLAGQAAESGGRGKGWGEEEGQAEEMRGKVAAPERRAEGSIAAAPGAAAAMPAAESTGQPPASEGRAAGAGWVEQSTEAFISLDDFDRAESRLGLESQQQHHHHLQQRHQEQQTEQLQEQQQQQQQQQQQTEQLETQQHQQQQAEQPQEPQQQHATDEAQPGSLGKQAPSPIKAERSQSSLTGALSKAQSAKGGAGTNGGRLAVAPFEGLQLSLCWHLLKPGMAAAEVEEVFSRHVVTAETFAAKGGEVLADPHLACRLGTSVCRWADALPVVVGLAAFGPSAAGLLQDRIVEDYPILPAGPGPDSLALPTASAYPSPSSSPVAGGSLDRGSSSWRGWLFGSWRGSRKESQQHEGEGGGARGEALTAAGAGGGGERDAGAEEVVPMEHEAALMAAAVEGRPSSAATVEAVAVGPEGRPGAGGKRLVLLKRRAFVPTQEQLSSLAEHLKDGQNTITFTFGKQQLRAYVYLVGWNMRLVISDIDGTITKSDVLGHLGHLLGYDWTQAGITQLFSGIKSNGYDLLFLSSRSIGQASITRDYLHSLQQNGTGMPHGPVIISPDGLMPSLYREVILRRPHEFKIRCLEDIRSLFPPEWNPFYAGFGNRDTDEVSYLAVGVPPSKIFIINPKGELRKASSIVRTSTWSTLDSLGQLLHQMFPALKVVDSGSKGGAVVEPEAREEYNDFNFWRVQPPIVIGSDDEEWGDPEATEGDGEGSEEDGLDGLRICG